MARRTRLGLGACGSMRCALRCGRIVADATDRSPEDGQRMALTISSFLSVSADPPLVSVCINRNSRMCAAITDSGVFGVHLLAHDQAHVADNFAGRPRAGGEPYDFSCVEWADEASRREPAMVGLSGAMSNCPKSTGFPERLSNDPPYHSTVSGLPEL